MLADDANKIASEVKKVADAIVKKEFIKELWLQIETEANAGHFKIERVFSYCHSETSIEDLLQPFTKKGYDVTISKKFPTDDSFGDYLAIINW